MPPPPLPYVPQDKSKPFHTRCMATGEACDVVKDPRALLLPAKHCAFAGCNWTLEWNEEVNKMSELCREKVMLRHLRRKT